MKKRKSHITSKIIAALTITVALLHAHDAKAEKTPRIWKAVSMAAGVEYSSYCIDVETPNASHAKTCYWWFRNTTDQTVHLMYAIRGDGYTVKQNHRVLDGIIVGRTELTLPPHYEQVNFECVSGQCLTAFSIKDIRALAFRKDDGAIESTKDPGKTEKLSAELAAASTTPAATPAAAKELQLCRPYVEVILGTCQCGSRYYAYDDPNTNRRICLKKESSPAGQPKSGANQAREYGPPPPKPEEQICGY